MNRNRPRTDPLATMAAANPAPSAELAARLSDQELERALSRARALGRTPSQPIPAGDGAAIQPGRRAARLGIGLAALAVLALLLASSGWFGKPGSGRPEFAAAAIRVAEANPRPLVTAPGWEIVRADELDPDSGELTFSDGERSLSIHWYPARLYDRYLRDRAEVSAQRHGTLLGQSATTVEYSPEEFATMLSPQGSVFLEIRGRLGTRPAYEQILRSLRRVDVETWLGAMPPSSVRPAARAEAVDRMLRGIPLPPGFEAGALRSGDLVSNRDSLAVDVGNAVACAWVRSWIAARAAGDEAAARKAVAALAGSGGWPIVRETKVPWFTNYRIVTRQLRAGRLDRGPAGYEEFNDRLFGIGPAWKLALGCEGTYRREVDALPRTP